MNVTIIGTGNMGRGLAHTLARGGHTVTLHDRQLEKAEALAQEVRAALPGATVQAGTLGEPLQGDVVILATWYTASQDLARQFRDEFAGKVVVDISNPLNARFDGLATALGTSAAEDLARLLPDSRVVKAFNTTFAGTLVQGQVAGQPLDVLVAGDDEGAKRQVLDLVTSGGLRGIDAGGLERARQLEGLGLLGITLQGPLGTGFMSAWKLLG
ncbi:NADPH-dependent F420 reductase [Deinococcus aestuarii]|uniref:NADPH-dependent F420 reductase n=1 Tax=Deinococcus aestuarii TaxID=2774531 RepID=UPI001C0CA405